MTITIARQALTKVGFGAIASLLTLGVGPVVSPSFAQTFTQSPPAQLLLAQAPTNRTQPKVELQLSADRQVTERDAQGNSKQSWQPLANNRATVVSGEVIRFRLSGQNNGEASARNVVFNQPIPKGTVYISQSARVIDFPSAEVQFSTDGGKTFSRTPMVKVRQADGKLIDRVAMPETYTHIRISLQQELKPNMPVQAEYSVRVR